MGKKKQLSGKNQAATTEQSFEESHVEHQKDSLSSDDTQPKENLKLEAREEQHQVEQQAEKESTNSLPTQTIMMISDEAEEHQQLSTPTTTTDYDDTYHHHHHHQQQQEEEEEEQVVHTEQNNMTPSSYDNIDVNDLIAQFPTTTTTTDNHYHNDDDDDKLDHFRDEPLHHYDDDDEPFQQQQQQPSYESSSSSTFPSSSSSTTMTAVPPPLPSHLKINKQQSAVFPPIPSNLLSLQQKQQQQQQVLPLYSIQKISNNTGLIIRFYQINASLQLNMYHPYARIVMQNESTVGGGGGGLFQQPSLNASANGGGDNDDESDESTCSLLQSICATRMNQEVVIAFAHPNTEQMRFETVVVPSSKQTGGLGVSTMSLFVRSFALVCAESHVQILKMNDDYSNNNNNEECQIDFSMSGLKNQFYRVSVTGGVGGVSNDASVVLAVPGSLYTKILCSSPLAATSPSAQDAQGNMDAWIVRSDRLIAFESTVIVSSVSDSGSRTDRLVSPASESCPLVRLSGKGRVYLSI